jgi:hypothetical protein
VSAKTASDKLLVVALSAQVVPLAVTTDIIGTAAAMVTVAQLL